MSDVSAKCELLLPVGGLTLRFVYERGPFSLGFMLYGLRGRTPQAWLYLSNGQSA